MAKLDNLSIRGFKSIEKLEEFRLDNLNVLIGANGAGKSNFVDFFRLLRAMVDGRFQYFVTKHGPADGFFFNGVAVTKHIEAHLYFGVSNYSFSLEPNTEGKIFVATEMARDEKETMSSMSVSVGQLEPILSHRVDDTRRWRGLPDWPWQLISKFQVYHFHDTSLTAGMRREVGVEQSESLQPDASNLAPFLLHLREGYKEHYQLLRKTLQRIAPYFDDFELRVRKSSPQDTVRLTWRRKGSDYIFSPGHLSDGTIRFLSLATVLLQPDPPTTIVLDEPELGLHPEALSVLGGLIRSASSRMQIILATQSPGLLSEFEPDQIITVDQVDGATRFNRLDPAALAQWLDDYTVGELWQKGTISGGVNNA